MLIILNVLLRLYLRYGLQKVAIYLLENNFYFRVKPGVKLALFTGNVDDELDLLFEGSGLIGYQNEILDINTGVTTINVITESDRSFNERNLSQLFATVSYTKNNLKPGIIIRIPLDDFIFNWTAGFSLAYTFNQTSNVEKN